MRQRAWFLTILLGMALALLGCDALVTVETSVAPPSSATLAQATLAPTSAPTTMAPAAMPTAAPLWTATPAPTDAPMQAATAAAQPAASAALPADIVAVVNGEAISRAVFDLQVQQAATYLLQQPNLDPKTEQGRAVLDQLRRQVLDLMIDQTLIQQSAARQGINLQAAQIETQLAQMRGNDQARFAAWLASNGMSEDDLRAQIRMDLITGAIRDQVTSALSRETPHLHVRHILLSESSRAQEALKRLQAGENFIAVAREFSEDGATRESGGDLGFVPQGVMPPGFDEAALALQPGQISGIVQSPAGFQIIQLVEIDPNRRVAERYWPQMQQHAFGTWLVSEHAKAEIQTNLD